MFSYNMLVWIIQVSIISFVFIFLIHHLLMYFKTTLTVPKIKDLVNSPNKQYKHIYEIIGNSVPESNNPSTSYTDIDLLPVEQESNMKDELKSFLKMQLNNKTV